MKFILTICLTFFALSLCENAFAQSDGTLPEPMIGRIEQVHFVTDPIFERVKVIKDKDGNPDEDEISITNACGYETASVTGFSVKDGTPSKIKVGATIGEWCQSKYIPIQGKFGYFLIIPKEKNTEDAWEIGSYTASIYGIYRWEDGWYVSPSEIRFGEMLSEDDKKLIVPFTPQGRLSDIIVDVAKPNDVASYNEEYLDQLPEDFPPPYFSIKDDTAYLMKAIDVKVAFPKASRALAAQHDQELKLHAFD